MNKKNTKWITKWNYKPTKMVSRPKLLQKKLSTWKSYVHRGRGIPKDQAHNQTLGSLQNPQKTVRTVFLNLSPLGILGLLKLLANS